MQIKFNPHLPPGYFETHELDGVSWRSEKPVRTALTEYNVALAVRKFERDARQELEKQRRDGSCRAVVRAYTVRQIGLEITRHPWERIPTVLVQQDRKRRGGRE